MKDTARTWVAAMLFAAIVPAQTGGATAALARAKVLEAQEGDLKAAEQAYRALLSEKDAAVQQEAALRLGSLLWKLDQKDAGKPFLEQAVAMGGELGAQATAVLQGQSEAALQEQEQLAKARAMLERITELWYSPRDGNGALHAFTQQSLDAAIRDLKWNGKVAAQVITDALGNAVNAPSLEALQLARNKTPDTSLLLQMLWEIGTPPADALLRRSAASPSVFWRRYVTQNAVKVAPDLVPVFVQFLHDPDPTGEVQRNLRPQLGSIPLEGLEALIRDPDDNAKVAGLAGLTDAWQRMSPEQRSTTFSRIREPLRLALRATDSPLFRAAYPLVYAFSAFGPIEARELVLESLAAWPDFPGLPNASQFVLDDRGLSLLLASARTLGSNPAGPNDEHGRARDAITRLVTLHYPTWTAVGINDLLTLIESGYSTNPQEPKWVTRFMALATPVQLGRLLRATPQMANVNLVLNQLSSLDETKLPKDTFEAARDVIEQSLKLPPAGWQELRQPPGTEMRGLLNLVGRSGSAAAPEWLTTLATRFPSIANDAANILIQLSGNGVGEPAANALRKFLVWEGSPEAGLYPSQRSLVFAELARLGDVPSIALFPRAYALGLQNVQPNKTGLELRSNRPSKGVPQPGPVQAQSFTAKGIGFLGLVGDGSGGAPRPWHGYAVGPLETAWRTLLASPAGDEVWEDLCSSTWGRTNLIPLPLLPLIAEQLQARWATSSREQRNQMGSTVLHVFGWAPTDPQFFSGPWVSAVRSLLGADDDELPQTVFVHLPYDVARQFAAEGRAILRRARSWGFFDALRRSGVELSTDDWLWLLQTKDTGLRKAAVQQLPGPLDAALQKAVEQNLADPDTEVRAAACEALARLVATDSVPALLTALRDTTGAVRKAAADALERLRFHQEQQAFWQDAKAGIDTSPQNAANKLLRQAQPQEPKDQRLLALRSLAVLGSPESLPYLIDWTKDPDAEVAAAALDAVTTIHRSSAKK